MIDSVVVPAAVAVVVKPLKVLLVVTFTLASRSTSVLAVAAVAYAAEASPANGNPVALVSVRLLGVPPAPLNSTGAPAEPVLIASAAATPVPKPERSATAICAQAGTAEIVPLPVWLKYFLVVVVLPASRVAAGVAFS